MIEMRWVTRKNHGQYHYVGEHQDMVFRLVPILQYRQKQELQWRGPIEAKWGSWIDVPIEEDEHEQS